jgi:hypothetical protein
MSVRLRTFTEIIFCNVQMVPISNRQIRKCIPVELVRIEMYRKME